MQCGNEKVKVKTLFLEAEKIPEIIFRAYILGAAEVNMARKRIQPVFSRPREIGALSQED